VGEFIDAFRSKRIGFMLALGFSSGLPLLLTGSTLTAWMFDAGVDLTTIGVFALVGLPYSLKPLWAPLLDRFSVPLLGRRRGWMVVFQLLLLVTIAAMGMTDPSRRPTLVAVLAFATVIFSASQDIVADAYRTDLLPENERGSGTAVWVMGYRIAMLMAGALALMLADQMHWWAIYGIMSGLTLVGIVATILAPEPERVPKPKTLFKEALYEPLAEFMARPRAVLALLFVMLYKVGDAVAGHLMAPFLKDIGFTWTDVGAIQKGLGMTATIIGALVGGGLIAKLGLRRSLFAFGILQAGANVLYMILAEMPSHSLLVAAIGVDSLCGGLGTTAFVAFLMALCNKRFTAFQFALLSSASSLIGRMLSASSGVLATELHWSGFFLITILAAAPALVIIWLIPVSADETQKEVEKRVELAARREAFFLRKGIQNATLVVSLLALVMGAWLYRSLGIRLPGGIAFLLGLYGLAIYTRYTGRPLVRLAQAHLEIDRRIGLWPLILPPMSGGRLRYAYGEIEALPDVSAAEPQMLLKIKGQREPLPVPVPWLSRQDCRDLAEALRERVAAAD
jgi:PAT family beta-lactamase induction signal transducer AmpG